MSFSFLGGLAGLLPGYLQGQRMAVNDNWNDLMKYNQAQAGQLQNAFTEATFTPAVSSAYADAMRNYSNMWLDVFGATNAAAQQPFQWYNSMMLSANAQPLAQYNLWNWMTAQQNAMQRQNALNGGIAQPPSQIVR